jgi:hypothetical protein
LIARFVSREFRRATTGRPYSKPAVRRISSHSDFIGEADFIRSGAERISFFAAPSDL